MNSCWEDMIKELVGWLLVFYWEKMMVIIRLS